MSFFKSLEDIPHIDDAPIGVKFSIIEYKSDSFLKKILDGTISNVKIENEIILNYKRYFEYDNFSDPNLRTVFQHLWSNLQFLTCVQRVLEENEKILYEVRHNYHYLISINKIAYDYYNASNNDSITEKDSEVLNTLLKIAEIVNLEYVIPLTSIVDRTTARFISMARYSSFDEKECVKRLNKFITCLGYDFTVKNIIYIYGIFYSDRFSILFNNTMLNYNNNDPIMIKEIDDRISLSILYILDSMESSEIYKVIKNYAEYIMLMNVDTTIRFSLHNLAEDFKRITLVVNELESKGFKVP